MDKEKVFEGPAKIGDAYRFMAPVRMNRGMHYGSNYYLMPSKKTGRQMEAFSSLEYYNFIRLEMDPNVEYYCEHPYCLKYKDEKDAPCESVFDVWVYYRDGREEFQEVKYLSNITGNGKDAERCKKQIKAQEDFCRSMKISCCVRTDAVIKGDGQGLYLVPNLEFLRARVNRYSRPEDSRLQENILNIVRRRNRAVISDLEELEGRTFAAVLDELALMYYKGDIDMDITRLPISRHTGIFLNTTNK